MITQRERNWLKSIGFGLLLAIGALVALFLTFLAHAQTACTVGGQTSCFVADKTTGESPLTVALTWNVVGATSCTAGGAGTGTAWNGAIACSGTRTLSGITVKRTLTIDATGPATAGKMRLSWVPPTQNTDGSVLTNLGGYVISYGTSASTLTQTINLAVPAANTFDVSNLTAGTWFASLQAANTACFPNTLADCHMSVSSNVTSKAVTTTPGGNLPPLTLVIDPYKVPSAPTGVVATDVTAFEITPNADGSLLATRVPLVPLSTSCVADQCTVLAKRQ